MVAEIIKLVLKLVYAGLAIAGKVYVGILFKLLIHILKVFGGVGILAFLFNGVDAHIVYKPHDVVPRGVRGCAVASAFDLVDSLAI